MIHSLVSWFANWHGRQDTWRTNSTPESKIVFFSIYVCKGTYVLTLFTDRGGPTPLMATKCYNFVNFYPILILKLQERGSAPLHPNLLDPAKYKNSGLYMYLAARQCSSWSGHQVAKQIKFQWVLPENVFSITSPTPSINSLTNSNPVDVVL